MINTTQRPTGQLSVKSIANPIIAKNKWSFVCGCINVFQFLQLIKATMTTKIIIASIYREHYHSGLSV